MRGSRRGGVPLVIRVSVEELQPLSGSAAIRDGEGRRFRGWWQLLHAISDLVASARDEAGGSELPPDTRR